MKVAESAKRIGSGVMVMMSGDGEDDQPTFISCEEVLGGISWPTAESPGYFCVFGQKAELRGEKNALVLLAEFESNMPSELMDQVLQAREQTWCLNFCGSVSDSNQIAMREYKKMFINFMNKKCPQVRYVPKNNASWQNGVLLIEEWGKEGALRDIPKTSILARQLGAMVRGNLHEGQRAQFYAVDAFKNVICELEDNRLRQGLRITVEQARNICMN